MCPFFILTFIFSILLLLVEITAAVISVTFNPAIIEKLHEGKTQLVNFTISSNSKSDQLTGFYQFYIDRPDVADITGQKSFTITDKDLTNNGTQYDGSFQVEANFLGYSHIEVQKKDTKASKANGKDMFISLYKNETVKKNMQLVVSVVRDKDIMQKIFIYSVAIVVSVSYINMGCALDTGEVYQCLRRPVAPAIGFFSQFLCMPLVSDDTFFNR